MEAKVLIGFAVLLQAVYVHLQSGRPSRNSNDETLIQTRIDRLMALRLPGWGWVNTPQVVLGIQLSKQRSFFGRTEAIQQMENELKNRLNESNNGELALYAMAVQSTCGNPRQFDGMNIIRRIKSKLNLERNMLSQDDWYNYALAIQALCVNQVRIDRRDIDVSLGGQNSNGSYGSSLDATSQMILALDCMHKQHTANTDNSRSLDFTGAISKAVQFVKLRVTTDLNLVWIGNKYSTPAALLALAEVNQNLHPDVLRTIEQSLKSSCITDENEGFLAQELPALRRQSVLDLSSNWECVSETDPVPLTYRPTHENIATATDCSQFSQSLNFFERIFAIFIQVRISVEYNAHNSTDRLITELRKDNTLLQVMEQAKCEGGFTFETASSSYGPYVTSVNGVVADPGLRQYWSLVGISDAGTRIPLTLGVGQYLPSDDEHIILTLTSY